MMGQLITAEDFSLDSVIMALVSRPMNVAAGLHARLCADYSRGGSNKPRVSVMQNGHEIYQTTVAPGLSK